MTTRQLRAVAVFDLDGTLVTDDQAEEPIAATVELMRELEALGIQPVIVTARTDNYYCEVRRLLREKGLGDIPVWCLPLDYIGMPGFLDEEEVLHVCQRYKTAARIVLGCVQPVPVHVAIGDTPWDVHHLGREDMVATSHSLLLGDRWYLDEARVAEVRAEAGELRGRLEDEIRRGELPLREVGRDALSPHRYHALLNKVITAVGHGGLGEEEGGAALVNGSRATQMGQLSMGGVAYDASLREIYRAAALMCRSTQTEAKAARGPSRFHRCLDEVKRAYRAGRPPPGETMARADEAFCEVATLACCLRRQIFRTDPRGRALNNIDSDRGDEDLVLRFCECLHRDVVLGDADLKGWFGKSFEHWSPEGLLSPEAMVRWCREKRAAASEE